LQAPQVSGVIQYYSKSIEFLKNSAACAKNFIEVKVFSKKERCSIKKITKHHTIECRWCGGGSKSLAKNFGAWASNIKGD
jgi:hypothetical protein